ncbi:MAG: rhodanese-like domain-containing protein [Rhodothermaceae bacterium]
MKKFQIPIIALIFASLIFLTACGKTEAKKAEVKKVDEFAEMMKYMEENGDFINRSKKEGGAPTMVKAPELLKNIDNYHIIDIRGAKDFAAGHIKGSVNKKLKDLIPYFESIDTKKYKKIVLVCYSGQSGGFATSALRLIGYDNVYDLKWGMASWNKKFAKKWTSNIGNKFSDKIETATNPKAAKGAYPVIKTGKKTGKEITYERAKILFANGFSPVKVKVDKLFKSPEKYYIVNYWPEKKYLAGHVPTAINYLPKKTLKRTTDLSTLPTDKPIVVYCYTGQHSAFITAYLRMLGYDARSLLFGANSFMNKKMVDKKWHGFSDKDIHDYAFETSEMVGNGEEDEEGC